MYKEIGNTDLTLLLKYFNEVLAVNMEICVNLGTWDNNLHLQLQGTAAPVIARLITLTYKKTFDPGET
ncbi:MAG: hypothetical protein LAT84_03040 [Balneolia bacterium]|nr:hypothetical protein [Balneolia bacterium]